MARLFVPKSSHRFDLENPLDLARLQPDTYGLLAALEGVVVIDEIQQMPEVFNYLRVIVDDPGCRARFLVTGSSSPELVGKTSETLAGRVHFIEAGGFNLQEVSASHISRLWFRGGFPRSFLAQDESDSEEWRQDFLSTYVMRDIARLAGGGLPPTSLAKLLELIAHFHGQFWNCDEVAQTLAVNTRTVRRYLEILEGAYLIRLIPPFERNTGKRVRKAHRLYFRDTGLLHTLMRIPNLEALRAHHRLGASWEGFGVEQVLRALGPGHTGFFWRTHAGAEIDLIVPTSAGTMGFEFKSAIVPAITRGTHQAIKDARIDKLFVIHSGESEFALGNQILALPLSRLARLPSLMGGA